MIYVSTGGARNISADKVALDFLNHGIHNIELSGGAYSGSICQDLIEINQEHVVNYQIHNYFPPPEIPFVLNLASLDESVARRSMELAQNAIELAGALGLKRYGVHAGFLLDPKVDELGRRIKSRDLFDKNKAIRKFIKRILTLNKIAEASGIQLMIENNVFSKKNKDEFGNNPLLMCDPQECASFFNELPESVGLLLDVAHLKVSANMLGFDAYSMFEVNGDRIVGYHLSDNDGLEDSNKPVCEDSWFWPYLNPNLDFYTLEIYGETPSSLKLQVSLVERKLELLR